MLERCPDCNELVLSDHHKCPPSFYVWAVWDDDFSFIYNRSRKIYTYAEEAAAIKKAERDGEDFSEDDELYVISVKKADEIYDYIYNDNADFNEAYDLDEEFEKLIIESAKKFLVSSEIVRTFWAEEIK